MYLLSAVLRHFPYAQVKFLDYGGLSTMNDLMRDPKTPNKIKIKTLTLINDLILEKV
jgi:nucleotide exchange factor SIL1